MQNKINPRIKKEILDLLYYEEYSKQLDYNSTFILKAAMIARKKSQIKFNKLSFKEKKEIYKKIINSKIYNYIVSSMQSSMCMYWVNGSPEKRNMRIDEYAKHKVNSMSTLERAAVCEILNLPLL